MRLALCILALVLVLSEPASSGRVEGAPQDDVSRAVERLASDHVAERNAAALALERLGPAGLDRLEKERDEASDPEVRGRLAGIVRLIRKREEFAKVLGATSRVTLRARARPAAEVAAALEKALGERIAADGIDLSRRIDLDLADATLWEAMDRLGTSMEARFDVLRDRILFSPGRPGTHPALYSGPFRVAVEEVQRLEIRSPERADSVIAVTLSLHHQRNVFPLPDALRDCLRIDSVTDAGGNEVRGEQPFWADCMSYSGEPFNRVAPVFARGDAVLPLTVRGNAALAFPSETRDLAIGLEDATVRIREGDYALEIPPVGANATGTSLTIKGTGPGDLRARLGTRPVRLVDDAGRTHDLRSTGGGGSPSSWNWTFATRTKVEKPRALILPWISELHWVEIPFRFEVRSIP